jgi:hypothetical protein
VVEARKLKDVENVVYVGFLESEGSNRSSKILNGCNMIMRYKNDACEIHTHAMAMIVKVNSCQEPIDVWVCGSTYVAVSTRNLFQ